MWIVSRQKLWLAIFRFDEAENDLYQDWLDSLRDRVAKVAIIKRVDRLEVGLFVDQRWRQKIAEPRH